MRSGDINYMSDGDIKKIYTSGDINKRTASQNRTSTNTLGRSFISGKVSGQVFKVEDVSVGLLALVVSTVL